MNYPSESTGSLYVSNDDSNDYEWYKENDVNTFISDNIICFMNINGYDAHISQLEYINSKIKKKFNTLVLLETHTEYDLTNPMKYYFNQVANRDYSIGRAKSGIYIGSDYTVKGKQIVHNCVKSIINDVIYISIYMNKDSCFDDISRYLTRLTTSNSRRIVIMIDANEYKDRFIRLLMN